MKIQLLAAALLAVAATTFAGGIPVYEPFADATANGGSPYTAGTAAWHQTNSAGDIWTETDTGATAANTVFLTNFSLSIAGLPASTGNSVVSRNLTGPGIRTTVGAAISTTGNNGVRVYYSMILAVTNVAALATAGDYVCGLNNGTAGADQANQPSDVHARLYFKKNGTTGYQFGISKNGLAPIVFDPTIHSTNETVFAVVSYEIVNTNSSGTVTTTNDLVRLWVNPSSSTFGTANIPPETLDATATDVNETSLTTFIMLNRSATSPNVMVMDEFRLGTNWAFVTGGAGFKIASPANVTVPFQGTMNLTNKAVGGPNITYFWQYNGTNISGATTSVLTVSNMADGLAGNYSAIASTGVGLAVTNTSTVSVSGDPQIVSQTLALNVPTLGSGSFNVNAIGTTNLTYLWFENGSPLSDGPSVTGTIYSGTQTATLNLSSVSVSDSGATFTCGVTNGLGIGILSTNAILTVQDPVIVTAPQNATAVYGATTNFTVAPAGTSPFTYQWLYNGNPLSDGPSPSASGATISGSHSQTLTISGVAYEDTASTYSVIVTNANNNIVTSTAGTLTVLDPYIVTQPTAQTQPAGGNATFTVSAAGTPNPVSPPLAYQWFQGNNPLSDGNTVTGGGTISGSTSASLTITGVADANAGKYYVAITGGSGSTTNSVTNSLTVVDPISIVTSPRSVLTERVGDHTAFVVAVTGSSPGYQWQFNGSPIAGATKSAITLTNIQTGSNGTYTVVVTNLFSTNSASATLNVINNIALPMASTNLIVARIGDGAQALSGSAGNTLYLDQFTTNGTYVSTAQIPDEPIGVPYGTGGNASIFGSPGLLFQGNGDSANGAVLTLSADNAQNLCFAGYCENYPDGGSDVTAGANAGPNWRGLGLMNAFGIYSLAYTNTGFYSGGNHTIRGMVTLDGTNFWTVGQASAGTIKFANSTAVSYAGGNGIPNITSSGAGGKVVQIFGGNLVFSDTAGASGAGLYACAGTPEPTTTTPASSLILSEGGQPNDFAFSPDGRTVYIADGNPFISTFSQSGGIQRWDTNNAGGWTFSYALQPVSGQTNGGQNLAVYFPPGITTWGAGVTGAVVYATSVGTSGNTLTQTIDNGSSATPTTLATAGINQGFRGVRFGPNALPPVITAGPVTQTNFQGNNVTFTVSSSGSAPFFYQWLYNGGVIAGATQSSFTTNNVSPASGGSYSVVVSNLTTQTASASGNLTVISGSPLFTQNVQSYTETVGDHLSLVGVAAGTQPLTYQWYKNSLSNPLSNQTNDFLSLVNVQTSDSGNYILVASNTFGTSNSTGTLTITTGLQALSPANLVVARIGDGVQPLSGVIGNTLYLDQYTTGGGYVNTIQIPDEGTGEPYGTGSTLSSDMLFGSPALLVVGGNLSPINDAPYSAFLTRAADGQTLDFMGYAEAYPFLGPDVSTGASNTWRGIGEVNGFGAYALVFTNTAVFNAGNHQVQSAVTYDQTNYWMTGQASSGNALKYGTPTNPSGGIVSIAGSLSGPRVVQVFGNRIVFTDAGTNSNQAGLFILPNLATAAATATEIIAETNSPTDFAISPDGATIYICDNSTFFGSSAKIGGIQRWDTNTSGGGYSFSYTLATGASSTVGARALTVDFSAHGTWGAGVGGAKLYATTAELSANRLITITDNGASSPATTLVTATATNLLAGVRFGPVVNPPTFVYGPETQVLLPGMTSATFTVGVTGNGPFTYQWQTNGVAVAGATTSSLTVDITQFPLGNYNVVVTGASGTPVNSPSASIIFAPSVTFNTNGTSWSANKSLGTQLPIFFNNGVVSNEVELTAGAAQQADSSFYNYPVYIGAFRASWTYQLLNPTSHDADGTVFAVQNDPRGPNALGGTGGSLGFSSIIPSVGFAMNVYPGAATGVGIALEINGASGNYSPASPVNYTNGDPVEVTFQYLNGTANVTMTDTVTSDLFTNSYAIDIPGTLGSQYAYVGFTGADGGTVSTQVVSNFLFQSIIGITASPVAPNSLLITWPTNVGGYSLQQSAAVNGGWSNSGAVIGVTNSLNEAVVPIGAGNKFFRLKHQ